jgi:hypothetical protein
MWGAGCHTAPCKKEKEINKIRKMNNEEINEV